MDNKSDGEQPAPQTERLTTNGKRKLLNTRHGHFTYPEANKRKGK